MRGWEQGKHHTDRQGSHFTCLPSENVEMEQTSAIEASGSDAILFAPPAPLCIAHHHGFDSDTVCHLKGFRHSCTSKKIHFCCLLSFILLFFKTVHYNVLIHLWQLQFVFRQNRILNSNIRLLAVSVYMKMHTSVDRTRFTHFLSLWVAQNEIYLTCLLMVRMSVTSSTSSNTSHLLRWMENVIWVM